MLSFWKNYFEILAFIWTRKFARNPLNIIRAMNEANPFNYQKRYRTWSLSDVWSKNVDKLKYFLLKIISRTWLKKRLYPGDYFYLSKWNKEPMTSEFIHDEQRDKYPGLMLNRIKYFEAVEIDNFHLYESVLLSGFKDHSYWRKPKDKEDFKERLGRIKTSMDSVTHGGEIFYYKFKDEAGSDLLDSAHIGYIKTFESYFILSVEVIPSKKFARIYRDILLSDDTTVETDVFNKFLNIVKTGIFVSHTSVAMGSIALGLKNLKDDLTYQIKKNITDRFRGMFFDAGGLPRIDYYEVDDISQFKRDKFLVRMFGNLQNAYGLDDGKVLIIPRSYFEPRGDVVRVIKEKGHGSRENQGSDLTDYAWVETHYLLQSLSLPSTLTAILALQKEELNGLKRKVYDYINEQSNAGFFKKSLFLRNSRRYTNLKLVLSKSILTFKMTILD